jgi:hypothetical protein
MLKSKLRVLINQQTHHRQVTGNLLGVLFREGFQLNTKV